MDLWQSKRIRQGLDTLHLNETFFRIIPRTKIKNSMPLNSKGRMNEKVNNKSTGINNNNTE
jgi:hypothetical protein